MTHDSRPVFAANWKMFKGPRATREFLDEFLVRYQPAVDRRVVFFPPSISVEAFLFAASARPDITVGVQDVHAEGEGAHTGAISASMAVEAGASWSLAGHSERRREFGDDDALVARKVRQILQSGLAPIVCVGETLEEREAGDLTGVLARQVGAVLAAVETAGHADLTWAYEPVWAIGTGRTASPDDAAEAHQIVRSAIATRAGDVTAEQAAILYGGSVKPNNIDSLMEAPGVNGVLVGGASLHAGDFAAICGCRLG
ncbi:MAG: triose-phosphate isomerase [Gemmatimonadota bacterium]|nr:triose-phosphate isomerase [Gemmatimonadota bacterium]MDH3426860.1 triose-phosphate isomerase [Gemmatimonadota bacterium]